MSAPAFDYVMLLGIGAGAAFCLALLIGLLFQLVGHRDRPPRLDRFGGRLDD